MAARIVATVLNAGRRVLGKVIGLFSEWRFALRMDECKWLLFQQQAMRSPRLRSTDRLAFLPADAQMH